MVTKIEVAHFIHRIEMKRRYRTLGESKSLTGGLSVLFQDRL
jgi:hypothetical protein